MAGTERDKLIGQNVTAFRRERTQKAIAEAMRASGHKWSQATVWSVEQGERPLKLAEALDLAQVLYCQLDDLTRAPRTVELELWLRQCGASLLRHQSELEDAAVWFEDACRTMRDVIRIVTSEVEPDAEMLESIEWMDDLAGKTPVEIVSGPMESARSKYQLAMDGRDISGIDQEAP